MAPPYLNHAQLQELHEKAIRVGLADPSRRQLLFAYISHAVASNAPHDPRPSQQVYSDLLYLNGLRPDHGREPELATWLKNAAMLVRPIRQDDYFTDLATDILSKAPPIPRPEGSSKEPQWIYLFGASAPTTGRLDIEREWRGLTEAIRLAGLTEQHVKVRMFPATRPQELVHAIINDDDPQPRIIHFSGHGTAMGHLQLRDDAKDLPTAVDADWLQELFDHLTPETRLVVLNACFSEVFAERVHTDQRIAVGTTSAIADKDAIRFSEIFYRSVLGGRTIAKAVAATRLILAGEHADISDQICIYPRDGGRFRLNAIRDDGGEPD